MPKVLISDDLSPRAAEIFRSNQTLTSTPTTAATNTTSIGSGNQIR